jgi:hypothetical protein
VIQRFAELGDNRSACSGGFVDRSIAVVIGIPWPCLSAAT